MMFDPDQRYTYIRPTDKVEFGYYFKPEDIYSVDGWYSCVETGGEWYISKGKVCFSLNVFSQNDVTMPRQYYSNTLGLINSKEECERLLKLKSFW